ncbi:MAG: hypothetical protein L6265_04650 [Thermoplasmatales archaeon]|nr:hypothetical protein [Thermoplasmatales archaeon]
MAKIRNAKGRREEETPSGYERLFGNHKLGMLISKVQSTVISTGNELENILAEKITNPEGVAIGKLNKNMRIFKKAKKNSGGKLHDIGADILIKKDGKIKLIELKDGDTFDTKKVAGEVESLNLIKDMLVRQGTSKENITMHFCSFNAKNHEQIERGAKGLLPKGSAMTGRELCNELGLDYDEIVNGRKSEQEDNFNYFLEELIKIPEVRDKTTELMKKEPKEKSFMK